MKRCSKEAWARCPDRLGCEMYAEFADGSECDQFNEKIIRENDGQPVDPHLVQPIFWQPVRKCLPETEVEKTTIDEPDETISFEISEYVLVVDSLRQVHVARYEEGPVFCGWVDRNGRTVRGVVYWAEMPRTPQEGET